LCFVFTFNLFFVFDDFAKKITPEQTFVWCEHSVADPDPEDA
jgi:hypothetical protein